MDNNGVVYVCDLSNNRSCPSVLVFVEFNVSLLLNQSHY